MTLNRANAEIIRTLRPYIESREKFQRSLDYWLDLSFRAEDAERLARMPTVVAEVKKKARMWTNARLQGKNIPFMFLS